MRRIALGGLTIMAALWFLFLGAWSVRTWIAEYAAKRAQTTEANNLPQSQSLLRRAMEARPDNADYPRLLAESLLPTDPEQSLRLAQRAQSITPGDGRIWRDLAYAHYELNQFPAAESDLQQAVRLDDGTAAHFDLANLAYLLGDTQLAIREFSRSLDLVDYTRLDPIAATVYRLFPDQGSTLARLTPGDRPDVQVTTIYFLLRQGAVQSAARVFDHLTCSLPQQLPGCRGAADALLHALAAHARQLPPGAAQESSAAQLLRTWQSGLKRGLVSGAPARPGQISDGQFEHAWTNAGIFAWSDSGPVPTEIVSSDGSVQGQILQMDFSGQQPSSVGLVRQVIVAQGQHYRLTFQARCDCMSPGTGLQLDVLGSGDARLCASPVTLNPGWGTFSADFTVPKGTALLAVGFSYQRPPGQRLLASSVQIANLSMQAIK